MHDDATGFLNANCNRRESGPLPGISGLSDEFFPLIDHNPPCMLFFPVHDIFQPCLQQESIFTNGTFNHRDLEVLAPKVNQGYSGNEELKRHVSQQ